MRSTRYGTPLTARGVICLETDSILRVPPEEPRTVFRLTVRRLLLEGYQLETVRDAMKDVFFDSFVEVETSERLKGLID